MFIDDSDYYYRIDAPLAVVYQRINVHQLVRWAQTAGVAWDTIAGWFPGLGVRGDYYEDNPPLGPEHAVRVMPYGDVSKPLEEGGGGCDLIIG